jgi:hypothetical protein
MATTIKSTALDFNNIKNNLKSYLANQDEFSDYNFEGAALSNILDVLAYNTHINGLIANFALNESYLSTAQLRSSAVSLSEGIGYVPDTKTSSQAKIRIYFTNTETTRSKKINLPAYTKFTSEVDNVTYTFSTIETIEAEDDGTGFYEFKTSSGSNQITIYEGDIKTKTFLVGEVIDNPVYVIPDANLDADTAIVKVYTDTTGNDFSTYTNIINTRTISARTTIYILRESPNGNFELSFGDGETFGIAPVAGNRIEIQYVSTNGKIANGAATFSPVSQLTAGGITTTLNTTTFTASTGGDAKESISSIKKNAPFQYATQNRMVTASDYTSLILKQYSTLIKDITTFGGQDAIEPEFGAVFTSILFEDDVDASTKANTKISIETLAEQLAIAGFNIRFADPVTTFIELDTFFQFNSSLTEQTLNSITSNVTSTIAAYFADTVGGFGQSFRRSNLLTLVDDVSTAVLSSRANVRMQQRFIPSSPNLIAVINNITTNRISNDSNTLNYIVKLVTSGQYDKATTFLINNEYATSSNFNTVRSELLSASISTSQTMKFPVSIATKDDDEYIITSSAFIYNNKTCIIRNKLSTNNLEIVQASGTEVIVDNIGSFDSVLGTVTVNYFNPQAIIGGFEYVKLAAVPANQSAITPTRNDLLVYDADASTSKAVSTNALN